MHLAAESGHSNIIQQLVSAGGLVACQDKVNKIVAEFLLSIDITSILQILVKVFSFKFLALRA